MRSSLEPELDYWIQDLRLAANSKQTNILHYANLTKERRSDVAARMATKPCRGFVLASHKSNLREYINPRIGSFDANKFYNWCFRLLLERVTSWAEQWQKANLGRVEPIELILERRGGHNYDHLFAYVDRLRMQVESNTLVLKGPGLNPTLLDRTYWRIEPKTESQGLQLADTLASAFYQAANPFSPSFDLEPAKALAPIIAKANGTAAGFGVTLFPLPHQAEIPINSRAIFSHFGYGF